MTDVRPPERWDRNDYAALPELLASKLRRAWRGLPGTQATTPNGAPFPLRSWPPDAALDIQHLAEWVDPLAVSIRKTHLNATIPSPSQSFPISVVTMVTGWSVGANTTAGDFTYAGGVFTCNRSGVYMVHARLTLASGPAINYSRRLYVRLAGDQQGVGYVSTNSDVLEASAPVQVSAGQGIDIAFFQNDAPGGVGLWPSGHFLKIIKVAEY